MDTPVQLTAAASEEQAQIIKTIGLLATGLDLPYCRTAAKAMIDQAGRQESLAVLNPSHRQTKNDLLYKQGVALKKLVDYVDSLHAVDEAKAADAKAAAHQADIAQLFL